MDVARVAETSPRCTIAIVGGGIAGLAAAFRLSQIDPAAHVTLIERDAQLGGKIKTERCDGFVIEAGPDSFLSSKPRGLGLCRDLGIDDRLQGINPATRRTFVMRDGCLFDLPEGLTGLVPTRLKPILSSGLLTPRGKARVALDYILPPREGAGDETLAHFIQRRLGREVYERLVEPLMAGIYAGDGRQLSLVATFPQLRRAEVEHGGLIKGVLASRRANSSAQPGSLPRSPFLAPQTGMAEIIEALEQRLILAGTDIVTGTSVVRIAKASDNDFEVTLDRGTAVHANAVILATPATISSELLERVAPRAATLLRSIPHVSTALVTFAFSEHSLNRPFAGHGYIIPRVEDRAALACTWVSAKWANRAPAGYALVRIFVGRAGRDDVVAGTDDALVELARQELQSTLGITAPPTLTRVRRWPHAMPQYTLGHLGRVAEIERQLDHIPGLYLAGHSYRGVGIPDCIASGESAADAAIARN